MCDYISYLKQVYPQGAHFDALLPKATNRNCYDLSKYDLECLGEIGKGALSTVYMVRDKKRHIYACKLTSLKHINGGSCPASFVAKQALEEINHLLRLQKKHVYGIMPIYSHYPSVNEIAMYARIYKFLPKSLIPESSIIIELLPLAVPFTVFVDELHRTRRRLNVKQACAVFLDILSPLEHMHKAKVIHRDIKLDNLMLIRLPDGTIRVAISDFNISREFLGTSVSQYTPMGTPGYNPRIDEKTLKPSHMAKSDAEKYDLYAAAQCMYILLNRGMMAPNRGNVPAPKDSPSYEFAELLRSILNPNISKSPSCSEVRKKLERMLKQDYTKRKPEPRGHGNFMYHKPHLKRYF